MKKQLFIAEVKTQSPFGFKSEHTWDYLFDIANEYGDIISIHTDPRWGGSFDLISNAKQRTKKPILAKGIHSTDTEICESLIRSADNVLVVGRLSTLSMIMMNSLWIEPNNIDQLKMVPSVMTAVWNSRDLSTGKLKHESWEDARKTFDGRLIQASNIKTINDVKSDADGYIVGENLVNFVKTL